MGSGKGNVVPAAVAAELAVGADERRGLAEDSAETSADVSDAVEDDGGSTGIDPGRDEEVDDTASPPPSRVREDDERVLDR
jgi:hypothetical protein